MMGHNPPHYPQYAEKYGFQGSMDWLAYRYDLSKINFDLQNMPLRSSYALPSVRAAAWVRVLFAIQI